MCIRSRRWNSLATGIATMFLVLTLTFQVEAQTDNGDGLSQSTYLLYCASCHGRTGKGDGPMAELLSTSPADLTVLAATNRGIFPYLRLEQVIDGRNRIASHGVREMPVWGPRFRREAEASDNPLPYERQVKIQIKGLIDYIASIQVK